jgi:hypothetical protein
MTEILDNIETPDTHTHTQEVTTMKSENITYNEVKEIGKLETVGEIADQLNDLIEGFTASVDLSMSTEEFETYYSVFKIRRELVENRASVVLMKHLVEAIDAGDLDRFWLKNVAEKCSGNPREILSTLRYFATDDRYKSADFDRLYDRLLTPVVISHVKIDLAHKAMFDRVEA